MSLQSKALDSEVLREFEGSRTSNIKSNNSFGVVTGILDESVRDFTVARDD